MSTRVRFTWGLVVVSALGLGTSTLSTRAQPMGDEPKRPQADREESGPGDSLEEARLKVELLNTELETEKNQLQQQLQALVQHEYGSWFMGMGGIGVDPNSDEMKKALVLMRERFERLRSAALETSRKLGQEHRRLAALEGRQETATRERKAADDRGRNVAAPKGRDDFLQAGKFHINTSHIDYIERGEDGWVRVNFSSRQTVILTGDVAKEFLRAIATDRP